MIRRWSRLNYTFFLINLNYKFYFKYLFKTFRKSLIFKKFYIKRTKFTRKQTTYLKHRFNWLLYSQNLKHWLRDFKTMKVVFKYQYGKNFHIFNYTGYDKNLVKTKKKLNLYRTWFYLSTHITRHLQFFLLTKTNRNLIHLFEFFKNAPLVYFSSPEKLTQQPDSNITTLTSVYQNIEYATREDFLLNSFQNLITVEFFYTVNLLSIVEHYRILILLWFFKIF